MGKKKKEVGSGEARREREVETPGERQGRKTETPFKELIGSD